jgi:hypothetical protein
MKLVKNTKKTPKKNPAPAVLAAPARSLAPQPPAVKPETRPVAADIVPAVLGSRAAHPTTIEAKIDVGFGNNLFLRGQGAGLSWDQGVPLDCVDARTWRWSGAAGEKLVFKLLLNDRVWAKGEDVQASPGSRVEVSPAF